MLKKIVFTGVLLTFAVFCSGQNNKNDEPNELSWEFFSGKQKCFKNFVNWSKQNESLISDALASSGKNNFLKPLPTVFRSVSIFPQAFPKRKGGIIQSKINGEKVIQLPAGHSKSFVRTLIDIPETGFYRIWAKYYHLKGFHSSFRIRILPPELNDYKFRWQSSSKGCFFNYRYDEALHKRKKNIQPTRKNNPTGFIWEGAPLVKLKAGCYSLEVVGCIHAGPYSPRRISNILITQDPLLVPEQKLKIRENISNGIFIDETEPSEQTRKSWDLWQLRPGKSPSSNAPVKVVKMWKKWRSQFITFLASGKAKGLEYECMTQMVYFNEDYNLIGTPVQVFDYIAKAKLAASGANSNKWFYAVEAEDMKNKLGTSSWKAVSHGSASGAKVIMGNYLNGFSGVASSVNIPADGEYCIWLRHMNLKKYFSIFHLGFRKDGANKDSVTFTFGDQKDKKNYPGNGMFWGERKVQLKKGEYKIRLFKNLGKSPFTYRRIDKIILTNDPSWKPEKTGILPGVDKLGDSPAAVWVQKETWNGFCQLSIPSRHDTTNPREVNIQIQPGEIASCLLLIRNNTLKALKIVPLINGSAAKAVQWRLVAYILSATYGWQPQPLLFRSLIKVPPKRNTALWLTIDGRQFNPGRKSFVLNLGENKINFIVTSKGKSLAKAPIPFVGGWSAPFATESAWKMYSDIGFNIIHKVVLPKNEMTKLNIRLFNLIPVRYNKISPESVENAIDGMQRFSLSYKDWTWEVFDEPGKKSVDKWIDAAKKLRGINSKIRIWCNPGEIQSSTAEVNFKMMPYIDVYCPYVNHFSRGAKVSGYLEKLMKTGSIKLLYTTPCFHEKAPHAPLDMFSLAKMALKYKRDGWNFFSICNYYGNHNSPWNDVGALYSAQAVSIYPGAYNRVISSRNLEAVRGAIQMWKKAKLKISK